MRFIYEREYARKFPSASFNLQSPACVGSLKNLDLRKTAQD